MRNLMVKVVIVTLVIFSLSFSQALAGDYLSCEAPVETASGMVKGKADENTSSCSWKGIPYAAPPVGELRFRAPEPPALHEGVFEAYEFGPACIQKEGLGAGGKSIYGLSEDCLTLNIWRPVRSGTFPVMVWIHGGGLSVGSSNYEMYEGARLAADQDVVVVSINYRLNVFGFFAHPDAAKEDPNGSTGNYGILDQIQALKWVQKNIAAFGGDPDNVTIFGESAGGMSVCDLLVSPPAAGLFHRGIIESGACDLVTTIEEGYEKGQNLAQAAGCDGPDVLSCLRDIPAEEFFEVYETSKLGFGSHVDGYVVPDVPIELIRKGNYNRMPVMVGNNKDEVETFLALTGAPLVPGFLVKMAMRKLFGPRYTEVMAMYPRSEYRRPINRAIAFGNEAFGSRGFMAAEGISGFDPVYYYSFDWDDYLMGKHLGAFHGLEIPLVFGNIELERDSLRLVFGRKKATENARALSEDMMNYWTNFARTGDPNGPGLSEWPIYNTKTRERIHLDTTVRARPLTEDEIKRYQYWADWDVGDALDLL